MRISDWSSDVCSSDLMGDLVLHALLAGLHDSGRSGRVRSRDQPLLGGDLGARSDLDPLLGEAEYDRHEEALVIVLVDEHVLIGRRAHLVAPPVLGAHPLVLAARATRRVPGPGPAN